MTAKRATRPSILAEGGFGAFVLDQLSALGGVHAKPMFGGAGYYLDGEFFGILYKERLYFRVSAETIGEYKKRRMKPFAPFKNRVRAHRYYEVPLEILESPDDLVQWAKAAQQTPPMTTRRRARRQRGRPSSTPGRSSKH